MQRNNLTARAATWSARHRRTAILGWLAFVIVTVVLGTAIGPRHIPSDADGVGQSARADRILNAKFPQTSSEQVLVQSRELTVRDPAFRSAIEDVVQRLSLLGSVRDVRSP